ncbi:MAG: V-type ATPase subunit [Planctomycetota bacterium]
MYDYLNARIKAMKGRLLPNDVFIELLQADDVQRIIEALLETPYDVCMSSALTRFSGAQAIDRAVAEDLYTKLHKLVDMVFDRPRELIVILLKRWDAYNIKSVLRAVHFGADPAKVESIIIPAGEIHRETLHELAAAENVRAALDLMATWNIDFAWPLDRAFTDYDEQRDLSHLEYAIDRFYFEQSLAGLAAKDPNTALVREIICMEADIVDIVLALRFVGDEEENKQRAANLLLGCGTLPRAFFADLLWSDDAVAALTKLDATVYAPAIQKGVLHFSESGKVAVLERLFEEILIRRGIRMGREDPLSIGVAIEYIWRKYNEFVNLRLLARCKSVGMPAGAIREELILA